MRETIRRHRNLLAILLSCFLTERAVASVCYPDYCQNVTDPLVPIPDFQCLLTRPIHESEDCAKLDFTHKNSVREDDVGIFRLHAYVTRFSKVRSVTAFNLSISDINFHRLTTRYRDASGHENVCRHIELYGNSSQPAPTDLYVSCPFSDERYEGSPYHLDYLATGKDYTYKGSLVFNVPQHDHIEDDIDIETFTPFVYIDMSQEPLLALYIQPLPASYNVAEYKIWLVENRTGLTDVPLTVSANKDGGHIRHEFSLPPNGVFYFKVAALHPKCSEYGCTNFTSPYLHHIRDDPDEVLVMIISIVWIPPVLCYLLYHMYKILRKTDLQRISRKPNCLLVYSPTHDAHVNVMMELTKYLRCCNINAMIDVLNVSKILTQDPGIWCNQAFLTADVVLVVTSPPSTKSPSVIVYRNLDQHLLRLLKENYPQRNKRYYVVQLPYCKSDSVPEEARLFKKFRLPEDLKKLVKTIHDNGFLRFHSSLDKELVSSIKWATKKFEDEIDSKTSTEETADLLSSIVVQEPANHEVDQPIEIRKSDMPDGNIIPQSFTTNIDELNLLGENGETESLAVNSGARNDCEFRIDKLKL